MVLAYGDRSRAWRHGEREMGRTVHDRLGWELDHCATMGTDWGCKDRDTGKFLPVLLPYSLEIV